MLKSQGLVGRSVKTLMGMDAPRTLKEKLAELKENKEEAAMPIHRKLNVNNRPPSQTSISAISDQPPQLGENTIEMTAVQKIEEEMVAQEKDEEQQAQQGLL